MVQRLPLSAHGSGPNLSGSGAAVFRFFGGMVDDDYVTVPFPPGPFAGPGLLFFHFFTTSTDGRGVNGPGPTFPVEPDERGRFVFFWVGGLWGIVPVPFTTLVRVTFSFFYHSGWGTGESGSGRKWRATGSASGGVRDPREPVNFKKERLRKK
ncbi:hypothetical protein AKJ49_02385 [candidate division MSBL1 archaeon SCGC-AAA382A03]|uniref:Uncharacterized protein n=1 Tax=candidate division MSBL1 archaeon SCGC-AAA382A03 TaxID=1698278 RepID=A0A133VC99_9EURY|nr:hypothetical protein AKJ49_02385 [candidate division MSBL1 archaeon SCGC-AAA382A03]